MKKKTKTRKTAVSKRKTKKPVRRKTTTKRKKTTLGKIPSARKAKLKKTIATIKNGLKALENEVKK
ncbi:MAG: hypothetical protein HXX16_03735 [Bacteroidales bacterium]|nr:hypothetical protein [Bacteroidales bacterium]